jgi:hypothetical protein
MFNFGNSNRGYVDPNLYSGIAVNYETFYDVYEKSETAMEKYSILRVVHIAILHLHQRLFDEMSIYTLQIMFILINYLVLRNFVKIFGLPLNKYSIISIFVTLIIPSYILETRWSYVNISGMTFTLLAIYYFVKFYQTNIPRNLILFGFFTGLATNTHLKFTYLLLVFSIVTLIYNFKFYVIKNHAPKIFSKIIIGIIISQLLIETIFFSLLKKFDNPIFVQTFETPLRLAKMRLEGNTQIIGSSENTSIPDLLDVKYSYLLPILILAIFTSIVFILINQGLLVNDKTKDVYMWVSIFLNSILFTFFVSLAVVELPILEVSWYFNMIWPLYACSQVLIISTIFNEITSYQRKIIYIAVCTAIVFLFFQSHLITKTNLIILVIILILATGFLNKYKQYALSLIILFILALQFLQPPIGNGLKISFQQYGIGNTDQKIKSLEFAKDQIWFSSLYAELHNRQNKIVPIWYRLESGLGDMQSSTGFCVTALHDCQGSGQKPDLRIWINNNGYYPQNILIMDTLDQSSMRIARAELNNFDYILTESIWSPTLNFMVGIFEKNSNS